MHWLSHALGLDNLSGPYYGFWSGSGSDITELALLGGLVNLARRHNCHQRRCMRVGHHPWKEPQTGLTHMLCRKHHPDHPGKRARDLRRSM